MRKPITLECVFFDARTTTEDNYCVLDGVRIRPWKGDCAQK